MTDKPDNGSNRFGVSEEPEAWSWSKRPGIKANQPKEDFAGIGNVERPLSGNAGID